MPLCGRASALVEGPDTPYTHSDGVTVGGSAGQATTERGERVCSKFSESREYLGSGWERAFALSDSLPQNGSKKVSR